MMKSIERLVGLLTDLRMSPVDFDFLYAGQNDLTPLESVELFLLEQQRLRVEKQTLLRRRRANLPAAKTVDSFDFGFQRSVSKVLLDYAAVYDKDDVRFTFKHVTEIQS